MTKAEFLNRLRQGLRGIPRQTGEEIMADYEGHFADGLAAGRSEAEIARALGDPDRLARDLRADAGIKQWEEKRNASSAVTAVFAVLGLGAIDFLFLLPILFVLAIVVFVISIIIIALFFGGLATLLSSLTAFAVPTHGFAGLLAGMGMMAGAIAWGALHTLICIGLVNALVWYGRLHIKVIQPVTEA